MERLKNNLLYQSIKIGAGIRIGGVGEPNQDLIFQYPYTLSSNHLNYLNHDQLLSTNIPNRLFSWQWSGLVWCKVHFLSFILFIHSAFFPFSFFASNNIAFAWPLKIPIRNLDDQGPSKKKPRWGLCSLEKKQYFMNYGVLAFTSKCYILFAVHK